MGYGLWTSVTADIFGWVMGYGLQPLLAYWDGVWAVDCLYCWYIGMGYGIRTTAAASTLGRDMGYGLWTACTAGI